MSEPQIPKPSPVRPAPFKLLRTDILDHRGRQVPWKAQHNNDSSNCPKPKSFWRWRERHELVSKHELRMVVLLFTPAILGLAAIDPFTKFASFGAKQLLPQYFGEGIPATEVLLTRIAISIAFYLAAAVITWIAISAWYQKLVIPEQAGEILRRGACVSCKYPIADLNPDSDGCTVCPECGAAWKLNARLAEGK